MRGKNKKKGEHGVGKREVGTDDLLQFMSMRNAEEIKTLTQDLDGICLHAHVHIFLS